MGRWVGSILLRMGWWLRNELIILTIRIPKHFPLFLASTGLTLLVTVYKFYCFFYGGCHAFMIV